MRPSFAAGVLALLLALPLHAVELAYHFQEGASWTYQVQNKAKIPTQGEMISNLEYTFTAATAAPIHLEADITGSSNMFQIQGSHSSFDLTAEGLASGLTSDMLNDPVDGAFVKNGPNFFFPLPGSVAVGETWQAQQTFHFPPLDLPGSFTELKTVTTFTYQGPESLPDGRQVQKIGMSSVHAPGSAQKVSFSGSALFDHEAGRMVKTSISGTVKVKAGFLWVSVPTTLSLVEGASAASQLP